MRRFLASKPDSETNLTLSRWDIYHISGGTTFEVKKVDVTLGLAYSFGSETVQRLFNLSNPEEESLLGAVADTELRYRRIKFLFGFNF